MVTSNVKVVTAFRVPTEGEFEDSDGSTIHLVLHLRESGRLLNSQDVKAACFPRYKL